VNRQRPGQGLRNKDQGIRIKDKGKRTEVGGQREEERTPINRDFRHPPTNRVHGTDHPNHLQYIAVVSG